MNDLGVKLFAENVQPMLICELKNFTILSGNKSFLHVSRYSSRGLAQKTLFEIIEERNFRSLQAIKEKQPKAKILKNCFWKKGNQQLVKSRIDFQRVNFKRKNCYLVTFKSTIFSVLVEPVSNLSKAAIDNLVNGLVVVDQNGKTQYVNESATRILSITRQQFFQSNIFEHPYWVYDEHLNDVHRNNSPLIITLRKNKAVDNKIVLLKFDNKQKWLSINSSPILDEKGKLVGAVSCFSDVTEEKKSREQIQKSEHDLKAVLNASMDGAFFLDLNFNILMFNSVAEDYVKIIFSRQIKVGENIFNFCPPGKADYFKDRFRRAFSGELVSVEDEFAYPGVYRAILLTRYLPVHDQEGNIIGISLSLSDITKRKEDEHRVIEKEAQLRNVAKMVSIGEWELDVMTRNHKWSDEVCRIHDVPNGYTPSWEEALNFYSVESRHSIERALIQCMDNGTFFDLNLQIVSKTNVLKWIRVTGLAERRRNVCIKLVGLVQDMTKQKEAEYEFSKMALIAKHTSNVVIISDANNKIDWVNEAFAEVTGFNLEEVHGYDPFAFLLKSEENKQVIKNVYQNLKRRIPFKFDVINYSKSGKKKWLEVEVQPVFNSLKKLINYIILGLNITERKESENTLAQQYKLLSDITSRLSLATKARNLGVWQYHAATGLSVWDERVYEILQAAKMDPKEKYMFWKERIHPDDKDAVMRTINEAFLQKSSFQVEMRWFADSHMCYLDSHGLVTLDENNNVVVTGVIADITQKKRDEISLKQTEERYRELFNASPLPTIFFERDSFQILDVNDAACAHYGYTRESFITLTMLDIRPLTEHAKFINEMNDFKDSSHFLGVNLKCDGTPILVEAFRHTIHYGPKEAILTTVIDVTEQMKLKEEENKLSHIITETVNEIFIVDKYSLTFLFINERAIKNLQYSHEELKSLTVLDIKRMSYEEFVTLVEPLLEGKTNRLVLEVAHYRKDGTRYENRLILQNLDDNRIIVIGEDISERKNYIQSLETLVKQKDSLVKEIHHRIKNNLQLISSIIYLKSSTMDKSEIKQFLSDTRNKIRSVALIHEQLLQSEEIDQVDISQYINKLVDGIRKSQFREDVDIRIRTDIESHNLKLDTSIYFGLIVNELVINAIKHAFNGRESGEIEISFRRKLDNRFILTIYDDGNVIPVHVNPGNTDSFGMQLLDVFVKQLRGQIEIKRHAGTEFVVEVPLLADP